MKWNQISGTSIMQIASRRYEKRGLGNGFVNEFTTCSAVPIYLTSISFASWQALKKRKRTSMCIVLWWNLGLLVSSIVEMLSHIKGNGCYQSGIISSSRRCNHTLSLAASHAATYSASVVGRAMHCWRRLFHAIGPLFKIKMNPEVDCRVRVFPA